MIIDISDHKSVEDVSDKFNDFFPFLKIEFYEGPHHWDKVPGDQKAFPPNTKLGEIRKVHSHGPLEIHSWFKTAELEYLFKKQFDLNVQVFRLNGEEWVPTIPTDGLTLREQNESGSKSNGDYQQRTA